MPLLNVPVFITGDSFLTTPTNASASTSLVLPNVVLFTEATPNSPMDYAPAPSNHSITLFHANQLLSQFDDNWISNQFNPFVKENIPPMIERVEIETEESWGWQWVGPIYMYVCEHAWAYIDVYVTEVAPYNVTIGVTDRNSYLTFSGAGGQYKEKHHAVIGIDYWADVACDYTVNVTLNDTAQNKAYFEKEIEGWFGGFLDYLGDIWNAMVGQFQKAWEAVKAAVDFIKEMVLALINNIIKPLLDPVTASIERLIQNLLLAMQNDYQVSLDAWNQGLGKSGLSFTSTISVIKDILLIITPLIIGISAIAIVAGPFVTAIPILIPIITLAVIGIFMVFISIPDNIQLPKISGVFDVGKFIDSLVNQGKSHTLPTTMNTIEGLFIVELMLLITKEISAILGLFYIEGNFCGPLGWISTCIAAVLTLASVSLLYLSEEASFVLNVGSTVAAALAFICDGIEFRDVSIKGLAYVALHIAFTAVAGICYAIGALLCLQEAEKIGW